MAPFALSDGGRAVALRVLDRRPASPASEGDYYSESLRLLTALR